jgi:hypothetical protein
MYAFSEKRRFNLISANFRFWHRTDIRFERIRDENMEKFLSVANVRNYLSADIRFNGKPTQFKINGLRFSNCHTATIRATNASVVAINIDSFHAI